MRLRLGVATVALLLAPLPARATPANAVAVPANGSATTALTTIAGMQYFFTVDGTFAYDSAGRIADACSRQLAGPTSGWQPAAVLLIDGSPAPCSFPSSDHHYTFWVLGTGSPFTFTTTDPTGTADNVGAFAVTVAPAVDAQCVPAFTDVTEEGAKVQVVVVAAESRAAPTSTPWKTSVECHVYAGSTEIGYLETGAIGVASGPVYGVYTVAAGTQVHVCYRAWTEGIFGGTLHDYSWPCL